MCLFFVLTELESYVRFHSGLLFLDVYILVVCDPQFMLMLARSIRNLLVHGIAMIDFVLVNTWQRFVQHSALEGLAITDRDGLKYAELV